MRSRTFQPWSTTSRKIEADMEVRAEEQEGYEYIIIGGPRSQVQKLREDPEVDVLVIENLEIQSASSTSNPARIIHSLPERPKNRTSSQQSHAKRTSNASSILSAFSDDADADDLSCLANGLSSRAPSQTQAASSPISQTLPKNHQLLCSELDALANGIELGAPKQQLPVQQKSQEEESGTQGWSHERRYLAYVYDGVDWSEQSQSSREHGDDFGGDLANCL